MSPQQIDSIYSPGGAVADAVEQDEFDEHVASFSAHGRTVRDVRDPAYGAVGDGQNDDTSAINNAIQDATDEGGGVVYLSPCDDSYGITCDADPIILQSGVTIQGSGYSGRIARIGTYEKAVGRRIIAVPEEATNTGIVGVYIDGITSNVTLAATQLNGALAGGETTITVDDTTDFPDAGELNYGTAQYSYTSKTATTFVGLSPVAVAAADNTPVYESVGNLSSQAIRWYPLDENHWHQHTRFQNNTIINWPGAAVHLDDVQNFIVSGNVIHNAQRGGIVFFHDCHRGIVSGNQVHSADDCIAVQANSNTATAAKGGGPVYFSISGNSCESFGIAPTQLVNNCFNIQGLTDSNITGNTMIGAGETGGANKAGLRLNLSDGANAAARYEIKRITVSGNMIYSPRGHGIYCAPDNVSGEPAEDLHIVGNQIIDAYERAIFMDGYVNRTSIVGNAVYNANAGAAGSIDAIRLDDIHNYLVSDNRVDGPAAQLRYGIWIGSASTNGITKDNYCPDAACSSRGFNFDGDTTNRAYNNDTGAIGSVGSATTVGLRDGYDTTTITGTTTIDTITADFSGRRILIRFAASCSVRHIGGGTGNIHLAGAVDFAATAADRLFLECDGTGWYEISRAVTA